MIDRVVHKSYYMSHKWFTINNQMQTTYFKVILDKDGNLFSTCFKANMNIDILL